MTGLLDSTLVMAALIGCALMAGLFFAFSAFIMDALGRIADHEGIRCMQAINDVIVRSVFMVVFLGTAGLSIVLVVQAMLDLTHPAAPWRLAAGLIYLLGCIGVTMLANVPLNNRLARIDASAQEAEAVWRHYLDRWTMWNHVRTVTCILATACLAMAMR